MATSLADIVRDTALYVCRQPTNTAELLVFLLGIRVQQRCQSQGTLQT